MAGYSSGSMLNQNTQDFPNNNSGQITPAILRTFNANLINSVQFTDVVTPNATSASYATTSSFTNNATSASYALTASFALNGGGGTINTGSFATTGSNIFTGINYFANDVSVTNGGTFSIKPLSNPSSTPYIRLLQFSDYRSQNIQTGFISTLGKPLVLDSTNVWMPTASIEGGLTVTGSINVTAGSITGSLLGTASYALSADTASYALNVNTTGFATTGSNSFSGSQVISGSLTFYNENPYGIVTLTSNASTNGRLVVSNQVEAAQFYGNLIGNADTATSAQSASFATTASFALNATFNTGSLTTTASFNAYTASMNSFSASMKASSGSYATTSSFNAYTGSTNAFTASMKTFTGSIQTQVNALQAATSSYVTNAQTSSMSVLSASFANTAGVALTVQNGLNISASNITVANNLTVNGTASFAYTKTVTGSAVIVGDAFIILNADTPTLPFAGIKVYDTGSASTASFEWNGNGDYWIGVEESGQSAGFLTGTSGSKGSEIFPSSNRLVKGTGNNEIKDSNITDNGTNVSINSNTTITGSLDVSSTITGNVTGNLTGTASFATTASFALNVPATASFAVSASYAISASQAENAVSSSFATSASYALNATSASYAPDTTFPFTGSAQITGSLGVTGSITATGVTTGRTGSLVLNQQGGLNLVNSIISGTTKNIQQYVTESYSTGIGGSNIYIGTTAQTSTGSLIISGSGNYVNVTALLLNANANIGTISGFNGGKNFILSVPQVTTGSIMTLPTINTSWLSNSVFVTNNNPAGTIPSINNSFINSTVDAILTSGSFSINNTNVNSLLTVTNTWSGSTITFLNSLLVGTGNTLTTFTTASDSTARTLYGARDSIIGGQTITTFIKSGSSSLGGIVSSIVVSNNTSITGSSTSTGSGALFGSWPTNDGRLNDFNHIRLAIGTGTGTSARRTSFYVSASGDTVIQNNLLVSGSATFTGSLTLTGSLNATSVTSSLFGTASYADNATSASYSLVATSASYAANSTSASYAVTASFALNAGAVFPFSGSAQITGSLGVTGSVRGNITTLTAVSSTASLDLDKGNAFTFIATAISPAAPTLINLTNYPSGSNQKFSLLVQQSVNGYNNIAFGSDFLFPSGSQYAVSQTSGSSDLLIFETYTI